MDFAEMVALLRDPGDNVVPPSIYDDLTTSYESTANLADVSASKIAELEASLAAATDEISRLKQHNYDLLMVTPTDEPPVEDSPETTEDDETGIDSLFDEDEDN